MIACRWKDGALVPVRPRDARFEEGRIYFLEETSDRSWISHSHQFAWLQTAWENLPERLTDQFPTPEALRKAALIATGWRRESIIDAGTRAAALRVAAYARGEDEFAHIVCRGQTVIVQKARSQRMHGPDRMDKKEFQESKDAIMGWIAQLLGVEPDDIRGAA